MLHTIQPLNLKEKHLDQVDNAVWLICMVYSVRRERPQRIQAAKASSSTVILDADIGVRNELIGCRLAKGLQSLSPDFLRAVVKICSSAKENYRIELSKY